MKNEYQKVIDEISVPQTLERRVLEVAVKQMKPAHRRGNFAAVCAVLVLTMLLGGMHVWNGKRTQLPDVVPMAEAETQGNVCVRAAVRGVNGGVYLPLQENPEAEDYDGTIQTLSILFADGSEAGGTYRIEKERLHLVSNEHGEVMPVPVLAGDAEEMTGLYAVPEDSRWLLWPVEGSNTVSLSNRYGYRVGPGGENGAFHAGIDIPAEQGTVIRAAAAGTVTAAEFDADRGNYVVLEHGGGLKTVYAHCLSLSVAMGDTVEVGQEIAAVGSTGKSTGPHLCFQVWQDGASYNPVAYFDSVVRETLSMG